MITQVIFKIDKAIKEKAQKKAKTQGLTFSDVLQMATRAFVEGSLEPRLVEPKKPLKPSVVRELKKISQDIKKGKNLSPAFTSVAEMREYLMK